ncbi:MAG: hypothetical protein HY042_01075, partial [Spirochaetia bacterium]|nr:hypothetical protein [Spirochaetia bacterium]
MKTLEKIAGQGAPKVPVMHLDSFQEGVLNALHLEFFFADSRFIVTPDGRLIAIGKPTDRERDAAEDILSENVKALQDLRRYLIHSLALHSPLLETNSYVISTNQNLVIARMLTAGDSGSHYEVKLYTIHPEDLPKNYKDKIYLGRAFLSLAPHEN